MDNIFNEELEKSKDLNKILSNELKNYDLSENEVFLNLITLINDQINITSNIIISIMNDNSLFQKYINLYNPILSNSIELKKKIIENTKDAIERQSFSINNYYKNFNDNINNNINLVKNLNELYKLLEINNNIEKYINNFIRINDSFNNKLKELIINYNDEINIMFINKNLNLINNQLFENFKYTLNNIIIDNNNNYNKEILLKNYKDNILFKFYELCEIIIDFDKSKMLNLTGDINIENLLNNLMIMNNIKTILNNDVYGNINILYNNLMEFYEKINDEENINLLDTINVSKNDLNTFYFINMNILLKYLEKNNIQNNIDSLNDKIYKIIYNDNISLQLKKIELTNLRDNYNLNLLYKNLNRLKIFIPSLIKLDQENNIILSKYLQYIDSYINIYENLLEKNIIKLDFDVKFDEILNLNDPRNILSNLTNLKSEISKFKNDESFTELIKLIDDEILLENNKSKFETIELINENPNNNQYFDLMIKSTRLPPAYVREFTFTENDRPPEYYDSNISLNGFEILNTKINRIKKILYKGIEYILDFNYLTLNIDKVTRNRHIFRSNASIIYNYIINNLDKKLNNLEIKKKNIKTEYNDIVFVDFSNVFLDENLYRFLDDYIRNDKNKDTELFSYIYKSNFIKILDDLFNKKVEGGYFLEYYEKIPYNLKRQIRNNVLDILLIVFKNDFNKLFMIIYPSDFLNISKFFNTIIIKSPCKFYIENSLRNCNDEPLNKNESDDLLLIYLFYYLKSVYNDKNLYTFTGDDYDWIKVFSRNIEVTDRRFSNFIKNLYLKRIYIKYNKKSIFKTKIEFKQFNYEKDYSNKNILFNSEN